MPQMGSPSRAASMSGGRVTRTTRGAPFGCAPAAAAAAAADGAASSSANMQPGSMLPVSSNSSKDGAWCYVPAHTVLASRCPVSKAGLSARRVGSHLLGRAPAAAPAPPGAARTPTAAAPAPAAAAAQAPAGPCRQHTANPVAFLPPPEMRWQRWCGVAAIRAGIQQLSRSIKTKHPDAINSAAL